MVVGALVDWTSIIGLDLTIEPIDTEWTAIDLLSLEIAPAPVDTGWTAIDALFIEIAPAPVDTGWTAIDALFIEIAPIPTNWDAISHLELEIKPPTNWLLIGGAVAAVAVVVVGVTLFKN